MENDEKNGINMQDGQTSNEQERTSKPFELRISSDEYPSFRKLNELFSLPLMLNSLKSMMALYRRRKVPMDLTDKDEALAQRFIENQEEQLASKNLQVGDILPRWVSAIERVTLDKLVGDAFEYGGNSPDDTSWVHVGAGVAEDFMKERIDRDGGSGVFFVYDGRKLTPITAEDKTADAKQTYYYAQKPKEGLKLKDTLLGMVVIDGAQRTMTQ